MPQFLPCPEGWVETNYDVSKDYIIPYCEPPEFNPENSTMTLRAPNPPNFVPCPVGWREVEDETTGVVTCDPFPEEGQQDCDTFGVDYAHFPGEPGCIRIGTECPEGDWAANLPDDKDVYYVKAGVGAGGDGSMSDPFGSINEALGSVGSNAVLALSKGTFDEVLELQNGIVLWGACVSETQVTSTVPSETEAVITTGYPNTEVRNLQISGQKVGVIVAGEFAQLDIHDVLIRDSYTAGIIVVSGKLSAQALIVRDTHARSDGAFGRGLQVAYGAEVEVTRGLFTNNREVGVFAAHEGTKLMLVDVVVSNTLSQQSDGMSGRGLVVQDGAEVEVEQCLFMKNRDRGVVAFDEGTKLTMSDTIISHTLERQYATDEKEEHQPSCVGLGAGHGLGSFAGAQIEMNRFVISKNAYCGAQLAFGAYENDVVYEIGGTLNLSNGIISHNELCGINVQTKDIDLDDLNNTVLYFENNYNNLDSSYLPTPEESFDI